MNLQNHIRPDLWREISSTYESKHYTHAILEAMRYLSATLRERSGLDGDGASLVGQALGGESPRLKLNKLQTETERDFQKGIENILRGLYSAIRNTRSHEQTEDIQETADVIIYFVNYLLEIINKSEEPFVLSKFLDRIFDPDFVPTARYAELLVARIPINKRLDTLVETYRKKDEGDGKKLSYIVSAILNELSDEQVSQFAQVVSDELETVTNDTDLIKALQVLPPDLWRRIGEVAQLRIEEKIRASIIAGKINPNGSVNDSGVLGIWARRFLQFFRTKDSVAQTIYYSLTGFGGDTQYIAGYFMEILPEAVSNTPSETQCFKYVCRAVRDGNLILKRALVLAIGFYPKTWQDRFVQELGDLTDPNYPAGYLLDGTPFLKGEEEVPL